MIVNVGAREVTCQFLGGPATSATCTIQYGTDQAYVNLPYTDSSNGTNVVNVTVRLSAPLQPNTLYYYVVSFSRVRLQGTFRSGILIYNQQLRNVYSFSLVTLFNITIVLEHPMLMCFDEICWQHVFLKTLAIQLIP